MIQALLSISHFIYVLNKTEEDGNQEETVKIINLILAVLIVPLLFYGLAQEFYQIRAYKSEYLKDPVNYIDLTYLFLTAFFII